jgi:UDP-N-acetylmuramoyl-tripeptide--D-alanyl-D-alanine ligase
MNIENLYNVFLNHRQLTTDSRKITKGCLFFAIKGETFDGNEFAGEAIRQGAAFAIIDNPVFSREGTILVKDVLETLQKLAAFHRRTWSFPVIGITGTNGKTTTKELVNAVLGSFFRVHATIGNLNNHIGVPLTILSAPDDTEIAIIEMGANHQGEIAFLCEIARPSHGLITNIGKAHLEGFGGFDGVIRTKNELYEHLRSHNGIVFVNGNNELLEELSLGMNRVLYGTDITFQTHGNILSADPLLQIAWQQNSSVLNINTQLVGAYNLENALAAISVGNYFKVPNERIKIAIERYVPTNNRSQSINTANNKVIMDAYNANPSSMQAALLNFSKMQAVNKVVILGDMLELGVESKVEHLTVIRLLESLNFPMVILVGPEFQKVAGKYQSFADSSAAYYWIKQHELNDCTILVKGSRGIKMEKLLDVL